MPKTREYTSTFDGIGCFPSLNDGIYALFDGCCSVPIYRFRDDSGHITVEVDMLGDNKEQEQKAVPGFNPGPRENPSRNYLPGSEAPNKFQGSIAGALLPAGIDFVADINNALAYMQAAIGRLQFAEKEYFGRANLLEYRYTCVKGFDSYADLSRNMPRIILGLADQIDNARAGIVAATRLHGQ